MSILSKVIYRFSAIPIKNPTGFLVEIDTLILSCTWKCEGTKTAKTHFKKYNKGQDPTFPNFKMKNRTIVVKALWY